MTKPLSPLVPLSRVGRKEKGRILDEFVKVTRYHRKHALRLLNQNEVEVAEAPRRGWRIYDDAVREAVIVLWKTADRICGKRLKAVIPNLVEAMERHGHLCLYEETGNVSWRPVRRP